MTAIYSGLDKGICKIVLHVIKLLCICVWIRVCICEPSKGPDKISVTFYCTLVDHIIDIL